MLTTDRLAIRPFLPDDAAAFAAYRSDAEVARYQSWDTPLSLEDAAATVAGYGAGDPTMTGWYQWAIARDGLLIGDIGVHTHENRMQAEIGFTIAAAEQGKGYGCEAVGRMVEYLFGDRGLHRISAECDARNAASARLLRKVGFQQEGLLRRNTWIKGEWTDDLLFGLLASDPR
ncbi:N-acetyltransferase [Kibdelosporangium aridum]|uniref:N-acetyltransferase n=1 Tax=Kibdelosporangium aridum TaxID=2030 RepID=A0A428ZR37_KIBAR|nr:GNAT family protein [Kibdelosporangium aridum]RSM90451.1 N-acetyltransferase [Kibdelosporangium aridum]